MKKSVGCVLLLWSLLINATGLPEKDRTQKEMLKANGGDVEAAYVSSLRPLRAGVIIVQGQEQQSYEWEVIRYLRLTLPEVGFATLGIDIPQVTKANKVPLAAKLNAGVTFLRQQGAKNVFIVLYGQGSLPLMRMMAEKKVANVDGIVLVSAYITDVEAYRKAAESFQTWRLPLLDVQGQFDYPQVIENVEFRQQLLALKPQYYRHQSIRGANHEYVDSEAPLMRRLQGFFHIISTKKKM